MQFKKKLFGDLAFECGFYLGVVNKQFFYDSLVFKVVLSDI